MTFQHWRPRLSAFLLQIRGRAVTVLGLSPIPTGIAGGGDIPGPSLSSLWLVWEVGSSAIVWVGFQRGLGGEGHGCSLLSLTVKRRPLRGLRKGEELEEEGPSPVLPIPGLHLLGQENGDGAGHLSTEAWVASSSCTSSLHHIPSTC